MTRALVLGGGGPVGVGWEAGLLIGLARHGVDPGGADAVVGTSAGSIVGATLAAGRDLAASISLVEAADPGPDPDAAAGEAAASLEALMSTVAEAAADPEAATSLRARLGGMALAAPTMSEEQWLESFSFFADMDWPARFACTAVDTADGTFQVWDAASGVDVQHALASSCAVPCVFPPVTIAGRRWMDGGVRDMLNTDAAAGHDTVLAVSCTLLELPEGFADPALDAVFGATRAQIEGLRRAGAKVETIVPGAEMLEVSGWGLNLMDFSRASAAFDAGLRQGEQEALRLSGFWAG